MQFLDEGDFSYLQELSISKRNLTLGDNDIEDDGVSFLKEFSQLEKLDLWNVKITTKGVKILW